ncbi:hypothetical protein MY1884_005218 [Beauveria asiatica]
MLNVPTESTWTPPLPGNAAFHRHESELT